MIRLQRKVAVVTGSSSGIGYETSFSLARNGYLNNTWKCYRCGLKFREEWIASLHKEISNHNSYRIVLNKKLLVHSVLEKILK